MTTITLSKPRNKPYAISSLFYRAYLCMKAQQSASETKDHQRMTIPVLVRKIKTLSR